MPAGGPGPVITAVPLPALAYPGMLVEIEAVAMRGADGRRLERQGIALRGAAPLPAPLSHGLRCGEMIFVGGLSAIDENGAVIAKGDIVRQSQIVMDRIGEVLHGFGAAHDDAVKINTYYAGGGQFADWEGAARVRARYFNEPGPAATGMPLPRHALSGSDDAQRDHRDARQGWPPSAARPCLARGPLGLADPSSLQAWDPLRADDLSGRSGGAHAPGPGDRAGRAGGADQDRDGEYPARARGFGAGFDDVVKVTAFYEGGASADQLHKNLSVRSACFTEPGPATTGIPLPFLAYEKMVIEIEIVADGGMKIIPSLGTGEG